jgi:hypothetical protein
MLRREKSLATAVRTMILWMICLQHSHFTNKTILAPTLHILRNCVYHAVSTDTMPEVGYYKQEWLPENKRSSFEMRLTK